MDILHGWLSNLFIGNNHAVRTDEVLDEAIITEQIISSDIVTSQFVPSLIELTENNVSLGLTVVFEAEHRKKGTTNPSNKKSTNTARQEKSGIKEAKKEILVDRRIGPIKGGICFMLTLMTKEILEDSYQTHRLIGLYKNLDDPEAFLAGTIEYFDDESILLASFTPYGAPDGWVAIRTDDVFRVARDSKYLTELKLLCQDVKNETLSVSSDAFISLLEFAQEHALVISVALMDQDCERIVGFVKALRNGEILLNELTEYGENDGETVFHVDDCLLVSCHGENEKKLQKLHAVICQE